MRSFRVGDVKRPTVRTTKPTDTAQPVAEPTESAGFPSVESRLEGSTVEQVADELAASYGKLEEMSQGPDMRKRGAAKKAMAAYERTADLFEYLFATKDSIGEQP